MSIIKVYFYPEKVKVKTWVEKYSRLRSVYKYEIFNEKGELATTGSTELICIKEDTFKPIRLDRYFLIGMKPIAKCKRSIMKENSRDNGWY